MSNRQNGFYWLKRAGRQRAVGRFEDGRWAILGERLVLTEQEMAQIGIDIGNAIGILGSSPKDGRLVDRRI